MTLNELFDAFRHLNPPKADEVTAEHKPLTFD